ncbi:MAG TPA: 16S rRNA (adenine(1518)-N(6)/adenine(1519)-N(6))-dimethyltransferase RsmA [Clostridiaceae bacterium]|nr:16S rRNA (adenine(1518)-N(6)/adenine(1519)-N(6))-dimethyltransferase RsmA [Clostridiaceae bacterium]
MEYNTRNIVDKYGVRFNKGLGQNFLIDNSVVADIVKGSEITRDDFVIEIGPGVGTLTKQLLEAAGSVTAIELDDALLPILREELKEYDNFTLIHGDAVKIDFKEIIGDRKVKFVANLPYYVTTPIIARILNDQIPFETLTIMIQKEVAERINAVPGTKDYGAITLLVQYYCDTEILRSVPPSAFIPRPKVDSTVIRLLKLAEPRAKVDDEKLFFRIIRQSFNMRRKTLFNGLRGLGYTKELIEEVFGEVGIDMKARGETLSVTQFADLSNAIGERA